MNEPADLDTSAETLGPLPNDVIGDQIVIASVIYRDSDAEGVEDIYLVLLLNKKPPYFIVADITWPSKKILNLGKHYNIVPAVREYEQSGGDY
jgi:hypothetical protein